MKSRVHAVQGWAPIYGLQSREAAQHMVRAINELVLFQTVWDSLFKGAP